MDSSFTSPSQTTMSMGAQLQLNRLRKCQLRDPPKKRFDITLDNSVHSSFTIFLFPDTDVGWYWASITVTNRFIILKTNGFDNNFGHYRVIYMPLVPPPALGACYTHWISLPDHRSYVYQLWLKFLHECTRNTHTPI